MKGASYYCEQLGFAPARQLTDSREHAPKLPQERWGSWRAYVPSPSRHWLKPKEHGKDAGIADSTQLENGRMQFNTVFMTFKEMSSSSNKHLTECQLWVKCHAGGEINLLCQITLGWHVQRKHKVSFCQFLSIQVIEKALLRPFLHPMGISQMIFPAPYSCERLPSLVHPQLPWAGVLQPQALIPSSCINLWLQASESAIAGKTKNDPLVTQPAEPESCPCLLCPAFPVPPAPSPPPWRPPWEPTSRPNKWNHNHRPVGAYPTLKIYLKFFWKGKEVFK